MSTNSYDSTFWNLVQAIRNREVVAFVGAGISTAVRGTPTWSKCIEELVKGVEKNVGDKSDRFKEFLTTLNQSANKDAPFAAEQCHKYLQDQFSEEIQRIFNKPRSVDEVTSDTAKQGLKTFLELPFHHIVTTNYDNLLNKVAEEFEGRHVEVFNHNDVNYFSEFLRNSDSNSRRSIFHVHGDLNHPDSIVLTESQYQKLYSRQAFVEFMRTIFSTKSALFIGFGLSDADILQIFRHIIAEFPSVRERHFAIIDKDKQQSPTSLLFERTRYNYKHGIGILYYEVENGSRQNLWKLIGDLAQEVKQEPKQPEGNIAIIVDRGFPFVRNLYDSVTFLNRVQDLIRYDIREDVVVEFPERFQGIGKPIDKAVERAREFCKLNRERYSGVFALTDKQEANNWFFCDHEFGGFISTWFWKYVSARPSIDEFLLHTLVLLTIHFYDDRYNWKRRGKMIKAHPDIGCLFDFTRVLANRIAIIEYPYICEQCRRSIKDAFEDQPVKPNIDWLRRVMSLAE